MPEDHNTKYNYSLIQQNYFLEFYYSVDTYVWQGKNGKRRENSAFMHRNSHPAFSCK